MGDSETSLDAAAAGRVRRILLDAAARPDTRANESAATGPAPADPGTVRGLAAKGLIRLYARSRDGSLPAAIERLSEDGTGSVRCAVAEDLDPLFDADPALASRITSRCASDSDDDVLYTITYPLLRLAKADECAALAAVEKMLLPHCVASDASPAAVKPLLFLALSKQNRRARAMLDGLLADTGPSVEARQTATHLLGRYLPGPGTQDGALGAFSLLLDSGDPKTRAEAASCLARSIERNAGSPAVPLEKIQSHLVKMSREADVGRHGLQILETLTAFLKKHWHLMPGRALGHLERAAALPESPYQAPIMMDAVETLNELFRELPDEDDRRRCLSVLDRFAMAGWPPALDLLRKMERPD